MNKGTFNGICNRTACSNEPATYFNLATKLYYCKGCAMLINWEGGRKDTQRLFGCQLLCTLHHKEGVEIAPAIRECNAKMSKACRDAHDGSITWVQAYELIATEMVDCFQKLVDQSGIRYRRPDITSMDFQEAAETLALSAKDFTNRTTTIFEGRP